MPRILVYSGILLAALALLPVAWLYRAQGDPSEKPRFHVVPDMDNQAYHRAQSASSFFADGRAMRRPVEGTVAQGELREDDAYYLGKELGRDGAEAWVDRLPRGVDEAQMLRGRERYQIFCAPCHGDTGIGDGPTARRAAQLAEGTWTPPSDLTAAATLARPEGELFDIITHGVRTMPAYGAQIPVADRWAIVAYLRALQRSANGRPEDVPASRRSEFR
ncbi:MAG: cytochrome c [Acidobacteriota bacterium]|nr:cytochrome c [Acidobacteriota bacterium]